MTSHEVTIRAGITYRQLDHWTRCGLIPGVERLVAIGTGVPRDWKPSECAFVMRLARYVRAGIDLRTAAEALADQTHDGVLPDVLRLADLDVTLVSSTAMAVSA